MKKILALSLAILALVTCLASCELIHTALKVGEHSCEYIVYESGHHKVYTCGCPSPDVIEEHYYRDGQLGCVACGYIHIKMVTQKWNQTHHWVEEIGENASGAIYGYEEHNIPENHIGCSVCGYVAHANHTCTFVQDEYGHSRIYLCGCTMPYTYSPHFDNDGDGICDECKYDMPERSEFTVRVNDAEWLY